MKVRLVILFLLLVLAPAVRAQISGPATAVRFGLTDPSTCQAGQGLLFYNTTSNTLKACTATDTWSAVGGGTGDALVANPLSQFAATTSAQLAGVLTNESGTGLAVFNDTPTLVTPVLGVASATSINKVAITAPATSATLTIANTKTLTVSNTLTLAGTDSTVMTFPSTSATVARIDAGQTFTGVNVFTSPKVITDISDTNGNEVFKIVATASAVNEFTVTNGATGTPGIVTLSATGGDTNINIKASPKGTGIFNVTSSTHSGNAALKITPDSGASFIQLNDNGTMVIDADSGSGSVPFSVKYNGSTILNLPFSGNLAVNALGVAGGLFTVDSSGIPSVISNTNSLKLGASSDVGISRNAANVLEVNTGTQNALGKLLFGRDVVAKTTDYTVVTADKNRFFTNTGAGAGVNFTLPTAAAGLTYEFYRDANQTVTVTAAASTTIRVGASVTAAAGNVTLDAVGSRIRLIAISTTQWVGDLSGAATFN